MKLADSCVWIEFLSSKGFGELEDLVLSGEIAICGTVIAEVLSGVRKESEAEILKKRFASLPYLDETREVFEQAAFLYRKMKKAGKNVPLSDCVIAAVCLINEARLLTVDKHFAAFGEPLLKPRKA
jgi:predicted nucleic acid-binding protein